MKITTFSKSIPFLVFCAFVLLSSCANNETILGEELLSVPDPNAPFEQTGPEIVVPEGVQTFANAHHLLWRFLEVFEYESKIRYVVADIHGASMNIDIVEIADPTVLSEYYAGTDELIIDKTFWKNSTDGEKELILFNALGHHFLNYDYEDAESSTGTCLSLMRSPSATCTDNYNANTRTIYLDELFSN